MATTHEELLGVVPAVTGDADLTPEQAADVLNVSRSFLTEQLERGVIPSRAVGAHRRVALRDVMEYKRTAEKNRLKALEDLSALDQELGLGY